MSDPNRRTLVLSAMLALLAALVFVTHGLEPLLAGDLGAIGAEGDGDVGRALNGVTLALGFLLLGAWLLGEIVGRFGLPRVVGYLLFGVLAGPGLLPTLGLPAPVTADELGLLRRLDALAISLIALVAGGEIKVSFLRGMLSRIATLLATQVGTILIGVGIVAFLAVLPMVPSLRDLPTAAAIHLSLVAGLLCVANSPAIVIAMIDETGARGPMCDTALAATVSKDLVLVVLLTILLAFVPIAFGSTDDAGSGGGLVGEAAWHLIGSIGFGAIVGIAMHYAAARIEKRIDVFIVLCGFAIAFASDALHLAPLLVALVAGFTQANIWPERSERMFHSIETLLLPVYCVFFATAGAGIRIDAVVALWPVALLLVGSRLLLVWVGTTAGAKLARLDPGIRPWLWTAFTPQAGVAIALANEVAKAIGDRPFVADLAALFLAAIAMNEVLGPLLMKWGLQRAGEVPASNQGR